MAAILIVDDDEAVGASIAAYLEDFGYTTRHVIDGEKAVLCAENGSFDLAIIDLRLPGMSGERLIRTLHRHKWANQFLIHTGAVHYSLPDDLKCLGLGAQQVFYKPLADLDQLRVAIEQQLTYAGR